MAGFRIGLLVFMVLLTNVLFAQETTKKDNKNRRIPNIGFFINRPVPEEALNTYDWIVVDAEQRGAKELLLKRRKARILAYVSIGDADPKKVYFRHMKEEWILGDNPAYDVKVVDLTNKEYFDFVLNYRLPRIAHFDGFFFDAFDSYKIYLPDKESERKVCANIKEFVKEVKRRYPNKVVVLNRALEAAEETRGFVDALVLASLFYLLLYDDDEIKIQRAKALGHKVIRYKNPHLKEIRVLDLRSSTLKRIEQQGVYQRYSSPYETGFRSYKPSGGSSSGGGFRFRRR